MQQLARHPSTCQQLVMIVRLTAKQRRERYGRLPVKPKQTFHSIIILGRSVLLSELFKLLIHGRIEVRP